MPVTAHAAMRPAILLGSYAAQRLRTRDLQPINYGARARKHIATSCAIKISRAGSFDRCRYRRRLTWITERVLLFRQRFEMTRHPLIAFGRPKLRLLCPAAI